MASILKITDGTTTVDFLNDAAYRITNWSPAVATRRVSQIAGRGPYDEVVEEMELFISGASAASKLATLRRLLDQAEQWGRGENVDVVTFNYKLSASSSELIAPIFGPPAAGDAALELPPRYDDLTATAAIDPVTLRFKRLGTWLAAADSAVSSSVANPTTATMALTGTALADSPYRLSLTGMVWNEMVTWNSFILATAADTAANAAKKLVVVEGEAMAAGVGQPASVSDTTNKARGNNVLRFTFTGAGEISAPGIDISASTHADVRRWAVFASVRNNSSSVSFKLGCYGAGGGRYTFSGWKVIPADFNDGDPAWVHVGWMSLRQQLKFVFLSVVADGAASIDVDAVVLMAGDDPTCDRVVAIHADETAATGTGLTGSRSLSIYHALDYGVEPYVYIVQGSDLLAQTYSGDPVLIVPAASPAIAAIWLACGQWNKAYWRATNTSGTVISNAFTAERMKAYLTVV